MYKLKLWLILLLGEKDKENNFFWYKIKEKTKRANFQVSTNQIPFLLKIKPPNS